MNFELQKMELIFDMETQLKKLKRLREVYP